MNPGSKSSSPAVSTLSPELARMRASIDNIDAALIHILAECFKLTKQVGVYKAKHDLPQVDPAALERLAKGGGLPGLSGGGLPGGLPGLPGLGAPKLPGLGGGLPGFPGLPKKK